MPEWLTIWAAVQGVAISATAVIAWVQLGQLREAQRAWKTLEACERYESDRTIVGSLRALRNARNAGVLDLNPQKYRLDVVLILNYFEGIAIAAAQGFYRESIVRAHLEPLIRDHVREFLNPVMAQRMGLNPDDFDSLQELLNRWKKAPMRTEF